MSSKTNNSIEDPCCDHITSIHEKRVFNSIIRHSRLWFDCNYCFDERDCRLCLTCGSPYCARGHHTQRHFMKSGHSIYISILDLSTIWYV